MFATGHQQEVTPNRQRHAVGMLDAQQADAVSRGVHLWVLIVTHRAGPALLDHFDGRPTGSAIVDADTMLGAPVIACYGCGLPYEARIRDGRCAGDPDEPALSAVGPDGAR